MTDNSARGSCCGATEQRGECAGTQGGRSLVVVAAGSGDDSPDPFAYMGRQGLQADSARNALEGCNGPEFHKDSDPTVTVGIHNGLGSTGSGRNGRSGLAREAVHIARWVQEQVVGCSDRSEQVRVEASNGLAAGSGLGSDLRNDVAGGASPALQTPPPDPASCRETHCQDICNIKQILDVPCCKNISKTIFLH